MQRLTARDCWIFDLDGTLTIAAHDFDAIRTELGLPEGEPILEAIARRPLDEAEKLSRRLDAIELEIAHEARAQEGAPALLELLRARGLRTGIVTRNTHANALATLAAAGLASFFEPGTILGRESTAPKPDPDGILQLLSAWNVPASRGLMVGDYRFDLLASRRAGTLSVYFDPDDSEVWSTLADLRIGALADLSGALARS